VSDWRFHSLTPRSKRIDATFRKYFQRSVSNEEAGYEVLVCHANVIRYCVCRALQFPVEGWGRLAIAHCSITSIEIAPNGKVTLCGLGESGHLTAKNLVTFS
jgi:serine/threonine-protein phosphatase PGAM5